MPYKKLFIWVEGPDDIRFFEAVIQPKLNDQYNYVKVFPYAELSPKLRKAFINSQRSEKADIIFSGDKNSSPCVTKRKETFINNSLSLIEDQIIVVVHEIESWYLAGVTKRDMVKKQLSSTDDVTKEQFNDLIPDKYESRTEYMVEMLKKFSIDQARAKNKSFEYFANKYLTA